jgi:hypothetical protein
MTGSAPPTSSGLPRLLPGYLSTWLGVYPRCVSRYVVAAQEALRPNGHRAYVQSTTTLSLAFDSEGRAVHPAGHPSRN